MKQRIIIAGGSGFMGQALAKHCLSLGWEVQILSRSPRLDQSGIEYIHWDGETFGEWTEILEGANVLVNLSGKSVNCRYIPKNKSLILHSRIRSTQVLGHAISLAKTPPPVWLNASSATVYEDTRGLLPPNDEYQHRIGEDFSMNIVKAWEAAFQEIETPKTRKVILRTAIVLGDGSAMTPLKRLAQFGLGGPQGPGDQWVSWIHVDDFVQATMHLIEHEQAEGVFNLAAPNPVPNKRFMAEIRKQLGVRVGMPQPEWILRFGAMMIGTEVELILKSRKVVSTRLREIGFEFRFPKIEMALEDLLAPNTVQVHREKVVS